MNKMNNLYNFWKNKNVLVTGHTGFKGSWMSIFLHQLGSNVIGMSDFEIISDNYKLSDIENIFDNEYKNDILDTKELNKVVENKIDVVFHFAAQGIVSTASKFPLKTIETNVVGTYNLLELSNNIGVNTFVVSTTDKVYLNSENNNIESDHLGGKEFYSASKASSEHIISAFINTRSKDNFHVGVVRSGNVLGGGDGAKDRIVTDVINSLRNNKDITLRNPNAIRPWQYILDSILGYLLTAQYCYENNSDEIFNLNSKNNNNFTVRNLVDEICNYWPDNKSNIIIENSDFYETKILKIDSTKANNLLNWNAHTNLNSLAKFIVDWESNIENDSKFSFKQINDYMDSLSK